jgi:hypothetical protein
MKTYEIHCTIADERRVVVEADSAKEAVEKIRHGHYKRLGRSLSRGFLIIGEPEERRNHAPD